MTLSTVPTHRTTLGRHIKRIALLACTLVGIWTLSTVTIAAEAAPQGPLFELTPAQFNARLVSMMQQMTMPKPTNQPGPVTPNPYGSTYQWKLSPLAELNGTVNKDTGQMSAAQLVTKGDGTAESAAYAMAMASVFLTAARGADTSESAKAKSASTVLELIKQLQQRKNSFQEAESDDGVILYTADQEQAAGTWFTVEPSEN